MSDFESEEGLSLRILCARVFVQVLQDLFSQNMGRAENRLAYHDAKEFLYGDDRKSDRDTFLKLFNMSEYQLYSMVSYLNEMSNSYKLAFHYSQKRKKHFVSFTRRVGFKKCPYIDAMFLPI